MEQILERIRSALPLARAEAQRVGPQHAFWDVIIDAEALLAGRQTLLSGTREEVAAHLDGYLAKHLT